MRLRLAPELVASDLRPVLLRLARELRKETEQLGITARQATLLWLVKRSPGLSLAELAAEEGISPPALSGHVDRLERAGLLQRVRSQRRPPPSRARAHEEGARLLRRVRARRTTWLTSGSRDLDPKELEAIEAAVPALQRLLRDDAVTTLVFALKARTFRSLRRHRNYRIFFTGQLVSLAGHVDAERRARLARARALRIGRWPSARSRSGASCRSPSSASSPESSPTASTRAGS